MKLVDPSLPWFVARTGIRMEDKAAYELHRKGYPVYVPKMRKEIIHHRKKTVIVKEFALFNRYLFVAVPTGDFYTARACDGVECFLGINGEPQRVSGSVVEQFQVAEMELAFDDTAASRKYKGETLDRAFPPNSKIRVKETHMLSGHFGQVVKAKGKSKVRAMMALFGGLVPVEFDASEVERAA